MSKRPLSSLYICARCLRSARRNHSTANSSATTELSPQPSNPPRRPPPSPPPASGAAHLRNRRLISLRGRDAPKFLQGITTNDVRPDDSSRRGAFYTAFLTAPGKVLSEGFVYSTQGTGFAGIGGGKNTGESEPEFLVEVNGANAPLLLRHLQRHRLRAKLTLRLLDEGEVNPWSVWREEERWTRHSKAGAEGAGQEDQEGELAAVDSRAPGMGQRVLVRPSSSSGVSLPESLMEEGVDEVPLEAYTLRRYLKGVPEGQAEIPWDDSLPMNCNIDLMGGIDFKKGCYIGQELTIRTHHTGVVRRRILPVMLYERNTGTSVPEKMEYDPRAVAAPPEGGAEIRRDDARKRATGKLLARIGNVGLAMCRLEQMSDVTISSEGSSFSPEGHFVVVGATGEELGVKAFVPDWVRGHIREPKIQRRVE